MTELIIPQAGIIDEENFLNNISQLLDKKDRNNLSFTPWSKFPYKPEVAFSIAYNKEYIFLKYYVAEKQIRANANQINGPVWEDSCVEFFISLEEGGGYYNIEFNCIGTGLIGYGKSRKERERLDPEVVNKVKTMSVIRPSSNKIEWELTLAIPTEVFIHQKHISLNNCKCRANFYKCGDKLDDPHFVTWSDIETTEPDFHRPEFFSTIIFD
jgi:hypothetical protein